MEKGICGTCHLILVNQHPKFLQEGRDSSVFRAGTPWSECWGFESIERLPWRTPTCGAISLKRTKLIMTIHWLCNGPGSAMQHFFFFYSFWFLLVLSCVFKVGIQVNAGKKKKKLHKCLIIRPIVTLGPRHRDPHFISKTPLQCAMITTPLSMLDLVCYNLDYLKLFWVLKVPS